MRLTPDDECGHAVIILICLSIVNFLMHVYVPTEASHNALLPG